MRIHFYSMLLASVVQAVQLTSPLDEFESLIQVDSERFYEEPDADQGLLAQVAAIEDQDMETIEQMFGQLTTEELNRLTETLEGVNDGLMSHV